MAVTRNFVRLCLLISAFALSSSLVLADDQSAQQEIAKLISKFYDKPNHKVVTTPIAVVDEYALADWMQGERGGRALLQRVKGNWTIMACGADGLKDLSTLTKAGIPSAKAQSLVSKLTAAEKSVDPHRLHLFSLFGTKNDPEKKQHHEHHQH